MVISKEQSLRRYLNKTSDVLISCSSNLGVTQHDICVQFLDEGFASLWVRWLTPSGRVLESFIVIYVRANSHAYSCDRSYSCAYLCAHLHEYSQACMRTYSRAYLRLERLRTCAHTYLRVYLLMKLCVIRALFD